jgi:HPt (histidine-containing phosphotransfer) domain-containing protein
MPPPDAQPPRFDPAAIDRIREMAGAEAGAFVAEMVELFVNEGSRSMRELQGASARADWKVVGRSAHSLKSSAATLGLMRLSAACRNLEADTREGAAGPGINGLIEEVSSEFDAALPILKGLGPGRLIS